MNEVKLSSQCIIKGGSGFPEIFQGRKSGDFPVAKVSDMELDGNTTYIQRENNYLDSAIARRLGFTIFPKDTVVFAKVGAALLLNRRRLLAQDTLLDNNMMGIISTGLDPRFLYHFMKTVDFGLLVQTGALPSLNQTIIGEIRIPIFTANEQRKIALILTTLDNLIEKTESLIAKYQAVKQGMMHDLFTRGVDAHGKLRPPQSEAPELYKQSELGWIPNDWEAGTLRDYVASLKSGLSRRIIQQDIGVPVITSTNIVDGQFDPSELSYWFINDPQGADTSAYILDECDILLNFINSLAQIGKLCLFRSIGRPCIYTTNIFRIKASSLSSQIFVYRLLGSTFVQREIKSITKPAVNQASFTTGEFLDILAPLIGLAEQQSISSRLQKVDEMIDQFILSLRKYKALKSGLMQDLLTGKVRVKVEESEDVAVHG